ncbi:DUF4129 domain-containing protein [Epilithonimonas mollis]|uniref:Protein-glutamine gamma-glutamyltransferase-like C-terminal domain-containing protein n=1 Tax=Epilithonimonas mollis TaxID=216903 RepID=A0A1M6RC81_9FLAO|nr:DUF4129 domain-containing protein [Epilithonimonas mollis]SHK29948.1 protein of unknown function [Epilithonimonas mollis]
MRFRVFLLLIFSLSGTLTSSQYEEVENLVVADSAESDIFIEADSLVKSNYSTDNILYPKKFDPNFKSKYKDDGFNYEVQKPKESVWELIKRKIAELLFKNIDPKKAGNYTANLLRFFGILIIGFLLFILIRYLMSKDGNFLFGKKNKKINIIGNDIKENIHEINFPESIRKFENENNYRSAIRYHFLFSLKKLADKNLISWNPEKTNRDYLKELKNKNLQEDFRRIIFIYDYIWYGELETKENDYQHFKAYFGKF